MLLVLLVPAIAQAGFPSYADRATTRAAPITFSVVENLLDHTAPGEHQFTGRSEVLPLSPGEVVFTNPSTTILPMPVVAGKHLITGFRAEVVDSMNVSVPLDEVYNHHWLVFDQGAANAGVCGGYLGYKFGVGAECRGTPTVFPPPYGVETSGELWGANIHLLRTVGLDTTGGADAATKNCIECVYDPSKGCKPSETGHFACCGDGSFCPTAKGAAETYGAKDYFLSYTVDYTTITEASEAVDIYVLDASGCKIEYNIAEDAKTGIHQTQMDWTIPRDMNVVFAAGHQHIGGINTTLSFGKDSGSLKPLCTSVPKYGSTQGKAGDEKGYVTALSTCTPANSPSDPVGKKGDVVRVDSLYNVDPADPRSFDKGAHYGVMSLFYIAVTKSKGGRAEGDGGDEALVAAFDQVAHA